MTREQLQGMISEGYNLNQIAAIHMISKSELERLLTEEATKVSPTGTSGKSKTVKTEEYQGTSGAAGTTGWINEEGL
jgi:hypothetical protein